MVVIKDNNEERPKRNSEGNPLSTLSETPTVMRIQKYIEKQSDPDEEEMDSNKEMLEQKTSMKKFFPDRKKKDFCECMLTEKGLFQKIYSLDSRDRLKVEQTQAMDDTFLIKGFGLRSLSSLQKFLRSEKDFLDQLGQFSTVSTSVSSTPVEESTEEIISSISSIHIPPPLPMTYLMPEEYPEPIYELPYHVEEEMEYEPPPHEYWHPNTSVRKAQRYLRKHKIFEFFHYLTAMLVSAGPENPIDFLMVLLDKVLLYRTGLLTPPLLYEKKHIEQLFHLMDRFGQGHVDKEQYKTAMKTIGICQFNEHPMLNQHGMVSKETFIEEILSAEMTVFNDLIRNRTSCVCARTTAAPPPTTVDLKVHTPSSLDDSRLLEFGEVTRGKKFYSKPGEKTLRAFKGLFSPEQET